MTEQTPANSPQTGAGGFPPVQVHVVADSTKGSPPAPATRRKKIITRYSTVIVTVASPVQPVLPADESRIRAVLTAHAGIGAGTSMTSYGWLADTQAAAVSSAQHQDGTSGSYISAGGTVNVLEVRGQNAAWLALDNNASSALTVSVAADYEIDA